MYGLKVIFKYTANNEVFYEEMILKVQADSFDSAYEKAWAYAKDLCDNEHINPNGDKVYESVLDIVDCFLMDDKVAEIEEVYSSIKKKPNYLSEEQYIGIISDCCTDE
jgi:hypothetical protein